MTGRGPRPEMADSPYSMSPLVGLGLMVGHDAMFPEAARAFGVKGADLICVPAALKYPQVASLGSTDVPFEDPILREADDVHWHLAPLPQRGEQCLRRFRQPVRRRLHRSKRCVRQARRRWTPPRGCRLGGPPGGGNIHRVYDSDPRLRQAYSPRQGQRHGADAADLLVYTHRPDAAHSRWPVIYTGHLSML